MMFRLEIKSILVTLLNCYRTVPDIKIYRTVNKSSYWIIIHLKITQGVKTYANLDRNSNSEVNLRRHVAVNLNDLRQVRQVSRS